MPATGEEVETPKSVEEPTAAAPEETPAVVGSSVDEESTTPAAVVENGNGEAECAEPVVEKGMLYHFQNVK